MKFLFASHLKKYTLCPVKLEEEDQSWTAQYCSRYQMAVLDLQPNMLFSDSTCRNNSEWNVSFLVYYISVPQLQCEHTFPPSLEKDLWSCVIPAGVLSAHWHDWENCWWKQLDCIWRKEKGKWFFVSLYSLTVSKLLLDLTFKSLDIKGICILDFIYAE